MKFQPLIRAVVIAASAAAAGAPARADMSLSFTGTPQARAVYDGLAAAFNKANNGLSVRYIAGDREEDKIV